jgi:hypothetical protein
MKRKMADGAGGAMKRAASDGTLSGEEEGMGFLRKQNAALVGQMHGFARQTKELRERMQAALQEAAACRAAMGCVDKHWAQLDSDLNGALLAAGAASAPSAIELFLAAGDAHAYLATGAGVEHSVDAGQLYWDGRAEEEEEEEEAGAGASAGAAKGGKGSGDDDDDEGPAVVGAATRARCVFTREVLRAVLAAQQQQQQQQQQQAGGADAAGAGVLRLQERLRAGTAAHLHTQAQLRDAQRHVAQLQAEQVRLHSEKHKACRALDRHVQAGGAAAGTDDAADPMAASPRAAAGGGGAAAADDDDDDAAAGAGAAAVGGAANGGLGAATDAGLRREAAEARAEAAELRAIDEARLDELAGLRDRMADVKDECARREATMRQEGAIAATPYAKALARELAEAKEGAATEHGKVRQHAKAIRAHERQLREIEARHSAQCRKLEADFGARSAASASAAAAAQQAQAALQVREQRAGLLEAQGGEFRKQLAARDEQAAKDKEAIEHHRQWQRDAKARWDASAARLAAAAEAGGGAAAEEASELSSELSLWKDKIGAAQEEEAALISELDQVSQSLDSTQSSVAELRQQLAAKEELNQSLMSASIKAKQQGALRQAELEAANTLALKAAAAAEAQKRVAEQLRAKLHDGGGSGAAAAGGLDIEGRRVLEYSVTTLKQRRTAAEGSAAQARAERDALLNDLQTMRHKEESHQNAVARLNEEKEQVQRKLAEAKKISGGGGDQLTKVLKNRLKKAESKLACTIKPVSGLLAACRCRCRRWQHTHDPLPPACLPACLAD